MLIRMVMLVVLLALCVGVHALVMSALLFRLSRFAGSTMLGFWRAVWVLIQIALWMVAVHLLEIGIWASFLTWQQVFPDIKTSLLFQRRDVHHCRLWRPHSA